MNILLLVEHNNVSLHPHTIRGISAALQISADAKIDLLVIGHQCDGVAKEAASLPAVNQVFMFDDKRFASALAEPYAKIMVSLAQDYQIIMAISGTFSKNCLPRVAAALDTCQISDVIAIKAPDCYERPIYAGNIIETVKSSAKTKVMTIRATAFESVNRQAETSAEIVKPQLTALECPTRVLSIEAHKQERPDLGSARVVVSGGRGLQNGENFKLIESLADKLGAAVGATRAAVDAGFIPNDHQVGQTGKVVAPELYIAVGISGAVQHLAGMKESKVIVAINKDSEAPIFQIADYGLVGDLFEILPQLEKALDKVVGEVSC